MINKRIRRGGHLWQGPFFFCPLDDAYLIRAARQFELNPVRVGLVAKAADWPWSSARAHLEGGEDRLPAGATWPPEDWRSQWPEILSEPEAPEIFAAIRKHTHTGHLFGSAACIADLEEIAGRRRRPLPRGRPKKKEETNRKKCLSPLYRPLYPSVPIIKKEIKIGEYLW
jgi:putative transposase